MAKINSAEKQALQSEKRRLKNLSRKTAFKTALKKVYAAIEKDTSEQDLLGLMRQAEAQIARAAGKNVIHSNTASRKISKLAQAVKAHVLKAN